MRLIVVISLALATANAAAQSTPASRQEIASVAALARLYGVVRYFYPGDAAAALDWNRFAVYGVGRVRNAGNPAEIVTTLQELFSPLGPGIEIAARLPAAPAEGSPDASLVAWRYTGPGIQPKSPAYRSRRTNRQPSEPVMADGPPPSAGAHVDIDLVPGVKARVRLALTDAEARTETPALGTLRAALDGVPKTSGSFERDVRLADVVVAWSVFRHFYPYWSEAQVAWDTHLMPQIQIASIAGTRDQHGDALRALVADARDGHGQVVDLAAERRAPLPILLRVIEGRLAIVATSVPNEAPVGAVVTAIDGTPAAERLAARMRLASGTPQWRQTFASRDVSGCTQGKSLKLTLEIAGGPTRDVTLACRATERPAERRPEMIAELAPGFWYVDLTRAPMERIQPVLSSLASATGVVFDLRGYPTDAGARVLPHLVDAPEFDRWMHVANITGPFGQVRLWNSFGWNVKPAPPRVAPKRVFLTDGRAISYSESVMGYVSDRKLATIIGSPTAGTNGNIVSFEVPGGFSITFTGMRVTRHDGQTPFHLAGVQPDILVEPTLAALREGKDELLDRALVVLRTAR